MCQITQRSCYGSAGLTPVVYLLPGEVVEGVGGGIGRGKGQGGEVAFDHLTMSQRALLGIADDIQLCISLD